MPSYKLDVNGDTNIFGNTTIRQTLTVNGNTTLSGNTNIGGNLVLGGTFGFTDPTNVPWMSRDSNLPFFKF